MPRTIVALAAAALAAPAWAVPVMDGTADAEYGAALSTQNTNTAFGNGTNGDPINGGGGSEIDQVFARVANGRLYVLIAGNLETNFNKLEVFIDSEVGGVNDINGGALPGGVDPFCCGGFPPPDGNNTNNDGALQRLNTLVFDAGFTADHYLTFTHGFENVLAPNNLTFYAASAHYADLSNGTAGPAGALGMQLAQRGLPQVLRGTTADVDIDGDADGNDFLIWQRNVGAMGVNRKLGDSSGNGSVGAEDLTIWQAAYGFDNDTATFGANYFAPQSQGIDNSNVLLGPALPGLSQGDLIDKVYALGPNGGATDNTGAGALTRELEFTLPPIAGTTNEASHRNMQNIVDLKMAIDNSNIAGVTGNGPYEVATDDPSRVDPDMPGNPQSVTTGVEFSIPLSALGNLTGTGIKITAFVNGGSHDFLANQVSGAGVLLGNLGGAMPDFELEFAGAQFVTVPTPVAAGASGAVPEPAAATLVVLAAMGLAAGRRRR